MQTKYMCRPRWIPLALLLAAGPAVAAHWVNITQGPPRAIYLELEALQRDGYEVRAWMREVYVDEQRSEHTGVIYYSANSLMRFDCARRTSGPLMRVFYGGDGTELRRIRLDDVELPATVSPGSLQEQVLVRACQPEKSTGEKPSKIILADAKPKTDVPPSEAKKVAPSTTEPAASAKSAPADAGNAQQTPKPDAAAAVAPAKLKAETPKPAKEPLKAEPPKPAPSPVKYSERKFAPVVPVPTCINPRDSVPLHRVSRRKAVAKPVEREKLEWSYEGKGAPQHWSEIDPENAACKSGKRQSPIDIRDGAKLALEPIRFDYKPSALRIIDEGHTVQINYAEGSFIVVDGVRYDLKQFHFHKPSEERIDGKTYDMAVHLVHRSQEGRLAVVAVLMEAGAPNAFLHVLWPHLPLQPGREVALPEVSVDLNALLPESRGYYAYMGSLTTPPCTEGVLWLVMKAPVTVSAEQVGVFGKLYSMNARPTQPANGRLIKESL